MPDTHGVVPAEDHLLPEGLHAMLEVSGGEQDIPPHHVVLLFLNMIFQILLPGHFNSFLTDSHLDRHIFLAHLVHTVGHLAVQLLQLRCEVGAPPHVARSEGEEYLEVVDQDIVRFDVKMKIKILSTAPTCNGNQKILNGDPIFSEMGTFSGKNGDPKACFGQINQNEPAS